MCQLAAKYTAFQLPSTLVLEVIYVLQNLDNHSPHSHILLYRQLLKDTMLLDNWKKATRTLRHTQSLYESGYYSTALPREPRMGGPQRV